MVISMALVLVGGFIFVIATIISRANQPKATCADFAVDLPFPARVEAIEANKQVVSFLVHPPHGSRFIVRYDGCTGEVMPRITLQGGVPATLQ